VGDLSSGLDGLGSLRSPNTTRTGRDKQRKKTNRKRAFSKHKKTVICVVIAIVVLIPSFELLTNKTETIPNAKPLPRVVDNATIPKIVAPDDALHNFLIAKQFYQSREPDKALPYLTKSLEEYKKISGAMSIEVARVYSTFGFIYNRMGNFSPARDNFNYALAIMDDKGEEYWEETGRLYYNRGVAYHGLGDTERASDDINEALKIVTPHPITQDILDYRFSIYLTKGKISLDKDESTALTHLDSALILKNSYDPQNQKESQGLPLFSVSVFDPILKVTTKKDFYFRDTELASILCNRAIAYFRLGEFEESEVDNTMAKNILEELPYTQQAMLSVCYSNFCLLAIKNDNVPLALEYASIAVEHSKTWSGVEHPYTGLMYEYQGESQKVLKRYNDALQSYLAAYKIFLAIGDQRGMDYDEQAMKEIYAKVPHITSFEKWLENQLTS